MPDFYTKWLHQSKDIEKIVNDAPRVASHENLKWEKTRQDAHAALMIAPETGFPTGGSLLMKAEIPVGWHTGKHVHGEEAIYIEQGTGFLALDDKCYSFREGTILHVPYRSTHQLFNTGTVPVVYLGAMAWHLESFIYMGSLEQIEDCGPNNPITIGTFPPQESQYWHGDGRRISMHQDQYVLVENPGHGRAYSLAGTGREGSAISANGFKMTSASISSIFVERPQSKSHSHAHPEAYLYCLQGKGYSLIDGERYDWEKGDAVHIPPGMKHHQHFNPTDGETKELRFEFGIRYWMVDQWEGYQRIEGEHTFGKLSGTGGHHS